MAPSTSPNDGGKTHSLISGCLRRPRPAKRGSSQESRPATNSAPQRSSFSTAIRTPTSCFGAISPNNLAAVTSWPHFGGAARRTPGVDEWVSVLGDEPVLDPLDELPSYLQMAQGESVGNRTLGDLTIGALERLFNALPHCPSACVVVTNLKDDVYLDGSGQLRTLIESLTKHYDRNAQTIRTVQQNTGEVFPPRLRNPLGRRGRRARRIGCARNSSISGARASICPTPWSSMSARWQIGSNTARSRMRGIRRERCNRSGACRAADLQGRANSAILAETLRAVLRRGLAAARQSALPDRRRCGSRKDAVDGRSGTGAVDPGGQAGADPRTCNADLAVAGRTGGQARRAGRGLVYAEEMLGGWRAPAADPKGDPTLVAKCPWRIGIMSTGLIVNGDDNGERGALAKKSFGVVILDEAHKARASRGQSGRERREAKQSARFPHDGRAQCDSVILGTATPIQLDAVELWDLLSALEPRRAAGPRDAIRWRRMATRENSIRLLTGERPGRQNDTNRWSLFRNPLPPAAEHRVFRDIRSDAGLDLAGRARTALRRA